MPPLEPSLENRYIFDDHASLASELAKTISIPFAEKLQEAKGDITSFDFERSLNGLENLPGVPSLDQMAVDFSSPIKEEDPKLRLFELYKRRINLLLDKVYPLIFDATGEFRPDMEAIFEPFKNKGSTSEEFSEKFSKETKLKALYAVIITMKSDDQLLPADILLLSDAFSKLLITKGSFKSYLEEWGIDKKFTLENLKDLTFKQLHKEENIEYLYQKWLFQITSQLVTLQDDQGKFENLLEQYQLSNAEKFQIIEDSPGIKFNILLASAKKSAPQDRLFLNEALEKNVFDKLSNEQLKKLAFAAASNGNAEIISFISRNHKHILREKDDENSTLMHLAALKGHLDLVKLLYKAWPGALYEKDDELCTPVHLAALNGHTEVVEKLIQKDPETIEKYDALNPLFLAVKNGHPATVVSILRAHPESQAAITNSNQYRELSCLELAASKGQTEILKILVSCFPENEQTDLLRQKYNGKNLLQLAVLGGHTETVKQLLLLLPSDVRKEVITDKNNLNHSSIHLAIAGGDKEIAQLLLENILPEDRLRILEEKVIEKKINKEGQQYFVRKNYNLKELAINKGHDQIIEMLDHLEKSSSNPSMHSLESPEKAAILPQFSDFYKKYKQPIQQKIKEEKIFTATPNGIKFEEKVKPSNPQLQETFHKRKNFQRSSFEESPVKTGASTGAISGFLIGALLCIPAILSGVGILAVPLILGISTMIGASTGALIGVTQKSDLPDISLPSNPSFRQNQESIKITQNDNLNSEKEVQPTPAAVSQIITDNPERKYSFTFRSSSEARISQSEYGIQPS